MSILKKHLDNLPETLLEIKAKKIMALQESVYNISEKVECENCGWEWDIEEGGRDPYVCHKCGHHNS